MGQTRNREKLVTGAAHSAAQDASERLFAGDGEMAALMRAADWAATPLGPVADWPPSLRMMVRLLLANRFPMLLWWGPDFLQLYNDAYRPVLGAKHPQYLGRPVRECWSEIIDIIGPLIETPYNGGPATWMEDIFLEINRHGYLEESHFTIAYSPVPDETAPSGIGGVLATVHEISEKVVGERRVLALRDLGARAGEAKSAEEACQIAAETLARYPRDLPFALLYLLTPDGKQARLAAAAGVALDTPVSPLVIELDGSGAGSAGSAVWPLAEVARGGKTRLVEGLEGRFGAGAVPAGPWTDPPHAAAVAPIHSNMKGQLVGFLVAGVSARLRFDDIYAGFLDLVSGQLATVIANARAYDEERRRAEALAEIDHAKTAFFSNVSHEFRTPLTLLLGPLEDALSARDEPLPPRQRERLEVMRRNGVRLLRLVNSLLDFARIEAGRAQAAYEPVHLAAYTADLASAFRSLVERAGMALIVDCPPLDETLAEPVYVDREMWEKIVLNLLSNAFKFTFAGKITVALRAIPPAAMGGRRAKSAKGDDAREVELVVRDTGTGIPAADLGRVFERFHRVQGARSRSYEGSGIGLALVAELVHLHGGTIQAASVEGVGTTFIVRLPVGAAHLPTDRIRASREQATTALGAAVYVEEAGRWLADGALADGALAGEDAWASARAAAPPLLGEAAAPSDVDEGARAARILIVDDNADMRDYLRRLFAARYETVEAAPDGVAALAAIRARPPDLVIADVMMPRLDGFGLLRALKDDLATRAIPVVLLSARAGEEATVEGLAAGADDYLVKPFSAREALARVAARLEIAGLRREIEARAGELEATFAAITDAVFVYDREGRIVRTNPAARVMFGLDALPDYERRPPAERAAAIAVRDDQGRPILAEESGLQRLLRGEELTGPNALDVRLTLPGGRELDVNIAGAPLRDARGAVIGAIAVSRDVTERKRLEASAHESLATLLAMAQALVAPLGETPGARDAGGVAAQVDAAAGGVGSARAGRELAVRRVLALVQRVFVGQYIAATLLDIEADSMDPLAVVGLTPEIEARWWAGLRGQPLSAYMPAALIARVGAEEVIELDLGGQPPIPGQDYFDVQRVLFVAQRLTDGQFCLVAVEARDRPAFTPQEGELVRAAVRLVALVVERERLTREREEGRLRELALEDATRRMDNFLGIASHELRTPLTSLTANIQMAGKQLRNARQSELGVRDGANVPATNAPAATDRLGRAGMLLERAERQVTRLDRLVSDLLDASRIQADKLELRREACDLGYIVREAVSEQRASWPERSITLDRAPEATLPVWADADRIGQVVINLLTNALKYSAEPLPVSVEVRLHGERARVAVRDQGPGLSPEQQARLFERFYRAPGIEEQSGPGVGLGLGLYICKSIVERHRGRIGVQSAPGAGATFWFTLPLSERARKELEAGK